MKEEHPKNRIRELLLSDQALLKQYPLKAEDMRLVKTRQAFIRKRRQMAEVPSLFLWQTDQRPAPLLFLDLSYNGLSGSRLTALRPAQDNQPFTEADLALLLADGFDYWDFLYDLELILPLREGEPDLTYHNHRAERRPYYDGKKIGEAAVYYFKRLEMRANTIAIPYQDFLLLVTCDQKAELIEKANFLSAGQAPENLSDFFVLSALNLVDEQGLYRPERWSNSVSDFDLAYPPLLLEAGKQVREYFALKRQDFDLPLLIDQGTDFQVAVWRELARIPYGETISYGDLAERVRPDSPEPKHYARACGGALNANPLPIFLPCHRVIGQAGELVGFGGGVSVKEKLLNLELLYGSVMETKISKA
ncbi:MAG: methylated-DNA--[protein]-cysteine S-methyltransferase [Eubacteriales bacterium]|nr:methylated-DNA--[protein]-cysteine S-methyltransferase [Eubacteriales bacterium]